MCTGLEWLMVGATAYNAVSQVKAGKEKQAAYDYQAQQASADAQAEREQGQVNAELTRRQGRVQRSQAKADLAASGVEVTGGTAVRIDQTIARNTEADALNQILYGTRKGARLDQTSGLDTQAGKLAYTSGVRGAVGSVLSGGAQIASGWKTGVRPQQPPAPVEDRSIVRIQ